MRTTILFAALLIVAPACAYKAIVRVVDETGAPVSGADMVVSFVGVRQGQSDVHQGKSDPDGVFTARGRSLLEVYMEARKEGHYPARVYGLSPKRDLCEVIVLPQVLNPVPLYAWDTRMGRAAPSPRFPVQNEWLGFDFEAADWVHPHGEGQVADILFRFNNEFKGWKYSEEELAHSRHVNSQLSEKEFRDFYGKWDAELEISFPNEKDGIFEDPQFWPYNRMKMPHIAPVDGYLATWGYKANTYSPPTAREDVGFFVRTRVKSDELGNIVSANYAKVVGDFHLDARGWIMFSYYFNPLPNDRNLEFDTKRNLLPPDLPGAGVHDP